MKSRDSGSLAIQKNSPQQFRSECWVPRPIQRHLIFFVGFIARVSKRQREVAIICEKKQSLSLGVQPPDVEEPRKFLWKQIKHGVARVVIFSGLNESRGFMQHDGKRWSGMHKFAIDFDMIIQVGLYTEVCADLAIDGDPTRRDQFITMSTRSDAGGGKKAIKAHWLVRCD